MYIIELLTLSLLYVLFKTVLSKLLILQAVAGLNLDKVEQMLSEHVNQSPLLSVRCGIQLITLSEEQLT